MPEYKEKVVIDLWWRKFKKQFRFRYESVPGIHKPRARMSDFYRYPRTQHEKVNSYIADGDEEFLTAAQIHKLTRVRWTPDAWDDRPRWNWKNTSWKRYRSTQYHPISIGFLSLQ